MFKSALQSAVKYNTSYKIIDQVKNTSVRKVCRENIPTASLKTTKYHYRVSQKKCPL